MAYKRKRRSRLRTYKRRKSSVRKYKPVTKAVVQKMIKRNVETKYNQHTVGTANIYQTITNTEVFSLIPVIGQGVTQSTRVGNKIKPTRFTLKLAIICNNMNAVYAGASSTYFDVYIFKWKGATQEGGAPAAADMTQFLQDDATAQSYNGQVLDGVRPVNSDMFTLLAKRRCCLNNIYFTTVGQMSGNYQSTQPQRTMSFDLTKHVKKTWLYDDSLTSVTNDSMYIAIGSTQCDGTNLGATVIGTYEFITNLSYKDA